MQQLRSRLISWVVSIFVFGFLMRGVDNWAHGGGLAAGFVLGRVICRPRADESERTAHGLRAGVAGGGGRGIASFVLMILHYRDPLPGS